MSEKVKKGIGGWLLLFIILLTIINPLVNFLAVLRLLDIIYPFQLPIGILTFYIIIEIILLIGFISFGIYVGASLWRVKPYAVKIAKIFLIISFIYSIISSIITFVLFPPESSDVAYFSPTIRNIHFRFIFTVIWFCYLTKSKRVKITYGVEDKIEEKPLRKYNKANLFKRFFAFLIDIILVSIVTLLIEFLGIFTSALFDFFGFSLIIIVAFKILDGLVTGAYLLLRDGFNFLGNRSIGKLVLKLKPIIRETGTNCNLKTSMRRNWPLAVLYLLYIYNTIVALFITQSASEFIVFLLMSFPLHAYIIIEAVLVISDDYGIRLGDKIARTQVIEFRGLKNERKDTKT